ncbi:ThiF family adenylyltransferase [Plantibacter sp. ME-Dv--P-095]|uniref:ThiF family adenylyltransferase n=1 Tax=Plantibacter sp. ME-Dv--P-095 TaxID=3040299 RepID=UPI00254F6CE3|nr:ThiF family adenylyltransferase [Plantibacter sp. ME-Dv--P-095]
MSSTARYARQLALPGFGLAAQRRLADARVLIVGAGGLGSIVIPALAAAGVGTGDGAIHLVDDDEVELSNLHRQTVHSTGDIGRPKVDSAADRALAINSDATIVRHRLRLGPGEIMGLLADARIDLVIDGSDNFETRYLVDDAATLADVPLVWGAVSQYGGQAGLSWASRGPRYRDLFPHPPTDGSILSCEAGGVLPTTVGVIGSIMATEAIKVLTGVGTPSLGRVTMFDGLSGGFRELRYERDPAGARQVSLDEHLHRTPGGDAASAASAAPHAPRHGGRTITAEQLAASDDGSVLLDVREPWEAEIARLPGSTLMPLGSLPETLHGLDPKTPVVVYCHHGIRSESALRLLLERGYAAVHLEGGIDAWSRLVDPAVPRY